ncbi:MAG: protein kinase [Planctomycetota bacterium]|nr:protein kinase [Planctomycetota bacterium]
MKFGKDGRYEFDPKQDRLGESPHSEVFKAKDTMLERWVALKILRPNSQIDPAAEQRFHREALHTGPLSHPNVAMVYDFATLAGEEHGSFDGASYIAMEYVEGRPLDKVVLERPLGYEEGLRVAEQLTDALAVVHDRDLVHRDLKPANLMLLGDGRIKLLDFGISRTKGELSLTQNGILVGTVLYMSPEQVRGTDLDGRSDLFSMGAVLYHVLTQELPFPGRTFPEVCMAILDGRPKRPTTVRSGFPLPLERWLLRCMAADPDDRYPDARAAHGALLEVKNELRQRGRATPPQALRGRLFLLPLKTEGSAAAEPMGRDLFEDLAKVLERSTELELVRHDKYEVRNTDHRTPRAGDLHLDARLALDLPSAKLDYSVKRWEGEADSWRLLWDEQIAHQDEDEYALQGQLVNRLARTMRRRLSDIKPPPLPKPTVDLTGKARAQTLRAHELLHRGTSRHVIQAMGGFRRALDLDPSSALAHAGMSEALVYKFLMFDGDVSFLTKAQETAHRALALDPNCPEAHTSLGFAYTMAGRASDARREYRLAIQLDHEEWLAHRLLGAQYARQGNYTEAISLLQRAIDLKPTHLAAYDHAYSALDRAGRIERAYVIADRGVEAGQARLERVPDDQDVRLHLALLLARRGSERDAREVASQARAAHPKDGYSLFHLACVHGLLGEGPEALALLHEAQDRGYYIQSELHNNTDLDLLRGNREFQEL